MSVYVGTAGWSYPSGGGTWDGVFYPAGLADRDKLSYYSQFFDAVEVNSTFYRPPASAISRAWALRVPAHFRFTAKLWQKFTHPRMFEEAAGEPARVRDQDFDVFSAGLEPLLSSGKFGALVAQFPPSFKPVPETLAYLGHLIGRLRAAGFPLAVELRHRDWSEPHGEGAQVRRLFEDQGVSWVMIDEPKFRTSIQEVPLTARLGYFRFHGRNYEQWWQHQAAEDRYNYLYSANEQTHLVQDVEEVENHAEQVYVFYNNHYRAKAVVNALQMRALLGQGQAVTLPPTLIAEYPELVSLPRALVPSGERSLLGHAGNGAASPGLAQSGE